MAKFNFKITNDVWPQNIFLPNITGTVYKIQGDENLTDSLSSYGALSLSDNGSRGNISTGGAFGVTLSFNASWSNVTYGNSSAVQPKSLSCIYLIKT